MVGVSACTKLSNGSTFTCMHKPLISYSSSLCHFKTLTRTQTWRTRGQDTYFAEGMELREDDVDAIMDSLRMGNGHEEDEDDTEESKRMLYEAPEWRQEI